MFKLSEYAQLFFLNLFIQFMTASRNWLNEWQERGAEGEEAGFGYSKKVKDICREKDEKVTILLKKITISRNLCPVLFRIEGRLKKYMFPG